MISFSDVIFFCTSSLSILFFFFVLLGIWCTPFGRIMPFLFALKKKKVMLMRFATSSMKIKGKNKSSRAQYNSMAICLVVLLPWEGLLCVLFGVMRFRLV